MREGLAARGEPGHDYTDDELRYALRVTLLDLAIEYGGRVCAARALVVAAATRRKPLYTITAAGRGSLRTR